MSQTDLGRVAIVGGGPVGLVTALALKKGGQDVTIIESGPDRDNTEWRGSTLHPPTIEMLDELGVAQPLLDHGVRLSHLVYRDLEIEGEAAFSYSLLSELTRFPFRVQYEQYKLVRDLKKALKQSGVETLYNHELKGIAQTDSRVEMLVKSPDGEEAFSAEWLVAADGSHSRTRALLGISSPGFTYPFQSLVSATELNLYDLVPGLPPVSYWSGPLGRLSLIKTPDVWRIAVSTRTGASESFDSNEARELHPDFTGSMSLLLKRDIDPDFLQLRQHQLYRSHQRVADSFRAGRVLLAGDAAHLSSTTGGMGLNSGVHDAYELAKAFTADDIDSALSSYAEGRRSIAMEHVQPTTTRNRQNSDLIEMSDRQDRLSNFKKLAANPDTAREHLVASSMLRVAGLSFELAETAHP